MPIGNQGCTPDLFANSKPKPRHEFIAGEANQRCSGYREKLVNLLRMEKSTHGRVRSKDATHKHDKHNDDSGQVFDAPVPIAESLRRWLSRHYKGYPQRDSGGRIPKVVNGVGQKGRTGSESNDGGLEYSCNQQDEQGPLYSPNPFL
jgi:hypothetical protein